MRKAGFLVVEVVVVVVVVGIVASLGVVGYNRWKQTQATKAAADTSQQQSAASSTPAVNKTSDLDKASTTLDQADLGTTDDSELDTLGDSF